MTLTQTRSAPRVERSPRWVRGFLNGQCIVDSKRVRVVYGERRGMLYYFPLADVRTDLLRATRTDDGVQWWSADVQGRTVEDIAWNRPQATDEYAQLTDYVAFDWKKMDAWYEEDDEVFVHPRDPYHRVDVLNSSRHVKVVIDGQVVAESKQPRLLFETGLQTRYYLPKIDIRQDLLVPSTTTSQCPYKGTAIYYSVKVGDTVYPDVIWSYPFPLSECVKIQGLLAFYNEKVELYIDGERWARES